MSRRGSVTVTFLVAVAFLAQSPQSTAAEKLHWAFQPPRPPAVPVLLGASRAVNPIDAFVLAELEKRGLSLNGPADKASLLRRVYFDLIGLPPSPSELDAFLHDASPDAYEKVIDRLLASPHYGERWAQHWLDLVRYAETDGFKADDYRPAAHRYRDYVIRSLNSGLPYDRFIRQQIAGDELEPGNPDALIATGLNRLYPDEYNAANLEQRRQEILDDVTDTNGQVFLGLTIGCARCHDHKYDPTSHAHYYALQSFFAAMSARDDLPAASTAEVNRYRTQQAAWEKSTTKIREEMESLIGLEREKLRKFTLGRFGADIQKAVLTPPEKRTPYQEQIAALAELQLKRAEADAPKKLPADKKKRYDQLEKELADVRPPRPEPLPVALAMVDVGRTAPPTHRLLGGNWKNPRESIDPAFPDFLGGGLPDTHLDAALPSTGRRAALARWLTRPDHPLTARVMVNRLWQHHFGVGIVASSGDFGLQGDAPTHPALLDWLAVEFVEHGWDLKHMHRLLVSSAVYQQSASVNPQSSEHARALAADPENKLLWHARRKRIEGEVLRDTALQLSGELNPRMFGTSTRPKLPSGISNYAWKADVREEDQKRRSVYVFAKRNMRFPLFDAFDLPDMHNSCSRRVRTTTAPQALLLLNGDFTQERATAWAGRLVGLCGADDKRLVVEAFREAWSRTPTDQELHLSLEFLAKQKSIAGSLQGAVADLCHALLNANEMLYLD